MFDNLTNSPVLQIKTKGLLQTHRALAFLKTTHSNLPTSSFLVSRNSLFLSSSCFLPLAKRFLMHGTTKACRFGQSFFAGGFEGWGSRVNPWYPFQECKTVTLFACKRFSPRFLPSLKGSVLPPFIISPFFSLFFSPKVFFFSFFSILVPPFVFKDKRKSPSKSKKQGPVFFPFF